MTKAQMILRAAAPRTWAERRAVAARIVQETGDLPEGVWYELCYGQDEISFDEAARELKALRPAGAPPYSGTML